MVLEPGDPLVSVFGRGNLFRFAKVTRVENVIGAEGLSGSLRGVNVADVFDPAFKFEVGKDWEAWETTHFVDMETGPKGVKLRFTNPLLVSWETWTGARIVKLCSDKPAPFIF